MGHLQKMVESGGSFIPKEEGFMQRPTLIAALLVIVSFLGVSAQITATVPRGTSITVDGRLDEGVWAGATKIQMRHDIGNQLTNGSVDDHNDLSTDFALLWDDEGFYCGSWRTDDIHNAVWGNQAGVAASKAWMDDGHEWWINFDFNDVWEDASPYYYGQFGFQVLEGFFWENGAPSDMYVTHASDAGVVSQSVAEMKEQGFYAPYSSADGINFQCEAQFKWSSFLLGSMATPSAGRELAFNIGSQDNDGGDAAQGYIRWSEGSHLSYQGWGKVTLSAEAVGNRRLRMSPAVMKGGLGRSSVYDILGRRISARRHSTGVLIHGNTRAQNRQPIKAIDLR